MQIELLLFGIVADLIGENSLKINLNATTSVRDFKSYLTSKYPQLKNYTTYAVAINETYANDDAMIVEHDVIALIPPVSGG